MTSAVPPPLRIGELAAPLPIIQGGMGVGVSLAGLASAVANEGGIGVIACAGIGMTEPTPWWWKDRAPGATSASARSSSTSGRMDHGFAFAGEYAHRATEIVSVKVLVQRLLAEYDAACR